MQGAWRGSPCAGEARGVGASSGQAEGALKVKGEWRVSSAPRQPGGGSESLSTGERRLERRA